MSPVMLFFVKICLGVTHHAKTNNETKSWSFVDYDLNTLLTDGPLFLTF